MFPMWYKKLLLKPIVRWISFRGDSAFYTWLYRIAVNTAKKLLVAQGRRPPSSDVDAIEAETSKVAGALKEISNPENLMLSEELRQIVFRTIESLPEDLRMAITLRELDGLSYEEIRYHGLSGRHGAFTYLPREKLLITKFNRLSGVDDSGILEKGIRHAERTTFRFNGWRNAG